MIGTFSMRAESSRYTGVGRDSIEGANLINDDVNEIDKFFPIESADGSCRGAWS